MTKSDIHKLFSSGLSPEMTIPYIHKGEWAIHELLPILLSCIGPADVRIATFNISEDSLRPLFFMLEKKEILTLKLLLDMNIKRHKLDLLLFAANITPEIQLTSTHMKVMLVENEKLKFGIAGSANMNVNPRYEAGFMFTGLAHYSYFKSHFEDIFNNDSLPFQWN